MRYSKWLAKLGAIGYDTLILINSFVNWVSERLGRGKISFSKKIKDSVKTAVKYINDFEKVAAELAIDNHYAYVVCGHIHQPAQRTISNQKGSTVYLNSGDWIENLTSLEYHDGAWQVYYHKSEEYAAVPIEELSRSTDIFALFAEHKLEEAVLFSKLTKYPAAS